MKGKRTPKKIKELQGTTRPSRELDNPMEVPTVDNVEAPKALQGYALQEWLKITGILSTLDMLADTDTSLLIAYCIEMGYYIEVKQRIAPDNYTFTSPNGHIMINPEITEANKSLQNAIKLADKFGFNPASRTKIEMPSKKPEDPFKD